MLPDLFEQDRDIAAQKSVSLVHPNKAGLAVGAPLSTEQQTAKKHPAKQVPFCFINLCATREIHQHHCATIQTIAQVNPFRLSKHASYRCRTRKLFDPVKDADRLDIEGLAHARIGREIVEPLEICTRALIFEPLERPGASIPSIIRQQKQPGLE